MKKDYDSTRIYRNTHKKGCVTDLWHTLTHIILLFFSFFIFQWYQSLNEWTVEGAEEMQNLLALLLFLIPEADFTLLMSLDELGASATSRSWPASICWRMWMRKTWEGGKGRGAEGEEEYEHDDSADSLWAQFSECLILRHLLQEAYRIIAKELPHGGGVA